MNSPTYGYMPTIQDAVNDKMRSVLIDWIIEVQQKFKLTEETLYLSVNLIDRYLGICKVQREKLQLLGVGAMLIASKYEEIYAPEVRDFVYISDKAYTKEDILVMEGEILSKLKFEVLQVSPYTLLKRLHFLTLDSVRSFYLAQYILEFSMLEYRYLLYSPSIKAASSLYIARKILKLEPCWSKTLQEYSNYQDKDLKLCIKDYCRILELIPRINLKACFNKFGSPKYLQVSSINMFQNN